MKPNHWMHPLLCLAIAMSVAASAFADDAAAPTESAAAQAMGTSQDDAPADFMDAITHGTVKVDIRARAEFADVRGFDISQAYTVRTRLGYETLEHEGWQGYIELEDVRALDDDIYNAAGLNGQPGRSVIADPEVSDLNQLYVTYDMPTDDLTLTLKPGRQAIAFDDQRFVGHVRWRQDDQTFDAASVNSDLGVEGLDATYAYVWKVNRIFADSIDFASDSHLFNASIDVEGLGKVAGFIYLLDFQGDSPAGSTQTYGTRLAGKRDIGDVLGLEYQASLAFQQDYADNPTGYDALYYMLDAGVNVPDAGVFGAGYEVLGSDDGTAAFQTPLATGHKFNGYADVFLTTPAAGLEDLYLYFKPADLPYGLKASIAYHWFFGNDGLEKYGSEIDAVLTKQINQNLTAGAKYAYFMSDEPGFAERTRIMFDLTLAF